MTRCAVPECLHAAGSKCAMAGCPGNRLRSTVRPYRGGVERKGLEVPPASSPTLSDTVSHDAPTPQVQA